MSGDPTGWIDYNARPGFPRARLVLPPDADKVIDAGVFMADDLRAKAVQHIDRGLANAVKAGAALESTVLRPIDKVLRKGQSTVRKTQQRIEDGIDAQLIGAYSNAEVSFPGFYEAATQIPKKPQGPNQPVPPLPVFPGDCPKGTQYCVYKDVNTVNNCYIVCGTNPNSPFDTLLGCADSAAGASVILNQQCPAPIGDCPMWCCVQEFSSGDCYVTCGNSVPDEDIIIACGPDLVGIGKICQQAAGCGQPPVPKPPLPGPPAPIPGPGQPIVPIPFPIPVGPVPVPVPGPVPVPIPVPIGGPPPPPPPPPPQCCPPTVIPPCPTPTITINVPPCPPSGGEPPPPPPPPPPGSAEGIACIEVQPCDGLQDPPVPFEVDALVFVPQETPCFCSSVIVPISRPPADPLPAMAVSYGVGHCNVQRFVWPADLCVREGVENAVGPGGAGQFGHFVGSYEWCKNADAIEQPLKQLAMLITNYGITGINKWFDTIKHAPSIVAGFAGLLNRWLNDAQNDVIGFVKQWKEIVNWGAYCNPDMLLSCAIVKAALRFFQALEIGLDIPVWGIVEIELRVEQVEEVIDYIQKRNCPTEIPNQQEAIRLYVEGAISWDMCRCWLLMNGCDPALWQTVIWAERERPGVEELGRLRNRGVIDDQEYANRMRERGVLDYRDFQLYDQFRRELPGPSDLVHFAVRHVFEQDIRERFGFNSETRPEFLKWHEALGFWYDVPELGKDKETGRGYTWADAHWWAHWIWPSPTQGAEMFFRLRPDRDKQREPQWMAEMDFTLEDLRFLLRGNDYPPYFRDRILAINQRLPGQRQMTQLINAGIWKLKQVEDNYLSMGYTPANAHDLAVAMTTAKQVKDVDDLLKPILHEYDEAVTVGSIDQPTYADLVVKLGKSQDYARRRLLWLRAKAQREEVNRAVHIIRDRYLGGELNEQSARQILAQAGVVQERIDQYLFGWGIERHAPRKTLSASQVLKWGCEGLISVPDVVSRLVALGYNPGDISILIADLEVCQSTAAAKKLQQQINAGEKQKRALEAAIAKQQAAADRARKRLIKVWGSEGNISKWLKDDIITPDDAAHRLLQLGLSEPAIADLIQDAMKGKTAKGGKSSGAAPPGPGG